MSEDLTGVSVHDTTLGLVGDITGSFLGNGGGGHTFDLQLTDSLAWTFVDTKAGGTVKTASGTYVNVPSSVPEPATLSLLNLGLAGIGLARRKRKGA